MRVLDLGCGSRKHANAIGLDGVAQEGVDVVFDLNSGAPLPFPDSEFDLVYCNFVLEHLNDLIFTVRELCRVTKTTGKIVVVVPHYTTRGAFCSPHHKQFFSFVSFQPRFYGGCYELLSARFTFNKWFAPLDWFANRAPLFYEKFFAFWFPAGGLRFELRPTHDVKPVTPWV